MVFFQTGSNDYVQIEGTDEVKIEQCMANKRDMFATFHEKLPSAKFVVMSGLLLPGRAEYLALTQEINKQLEAFCEEYILSATVNQRNVQQKNALNRRSAGRIFRYG